MGFLVVFSSPPGFFEMTLGCFDWRDRLSFEGFLTPKKQWRNRFQAYIYMYMGQGFLLFFVGLRFCIPFRVFFVVGKDLVHLMTSGTQTHTIQASPRKFLR